MPPKKRRGKTKQQRIRQRRKARRPTEIEKRAKRDVRLAYGGQFDALKREKKRAEGEYKETDVRLQDIYGDLAQALAPLLGNYEAGAQQITGDYNQAVGGLSNTFTQAPVMGTEGASQAAANLFGTIGTGGNTLLANDRMRNLGYQTSAQRQGALEQKDARFDALDAYKQIVDDIRERRLDIRGDMPAVIKQRLDELKEQRFGRKLQKRELDIAEEQFGKEFGLRKRAANQKNRRKNRELDTAETYLRDEDADKAARRTKRQTKGALANINEQLAHINAAIGPITGGADSPVDSGLYKKRKRLTRRKRRIKRRRRSAQSELRD